MVASSPQSRKVLAQGKAGIWQRFGHAHVQAVEDDLGPVGTVQNPEEHPCDVGVIESVGRVFPGNLTELEGGCVVEVEAVEQALDGTAIQRYGEL